MNIRRSKIKFPDYWGWREKVGIILPPDYADENQGDKK
jgi:hypothetical protein